MIFKKVFSITPNPTIDLNGDTDKITPNEKNYITHETRFAGGNAINASLILSRLNCPVLLSGFLGGATGTQVENILKKEKLITEFIQIAGDTRINVTISNQSTHKQTRFSFPGPHIKTSEKELLLKQSSNKKQGTLFVLGGSFPPNFKVKDAKSIIKNAHKNKIATIVDIPSTHLRAVLQSKPLMIKPNLFEFEQLVGQKLKTLRQIEDEAKKLLKKCPIICISSVNKGILLVTENASYFAKGPYVKAKSSVGAGDSLVGGMVAGMIEEGFSYEMFFDSQNNNFSNNNISNSWHKIIKFGMGAALATISQHGTKLGNKKEIIKFSKKIKITKI